MIRIPVEECVPNHRNRQLEVIERELADFNTRLQQAWKNNRCQTCPIGELAAMSAALLMVVKVFREAEADSV